MRIASFWIVSAWFSLVLSECANTTAGDDPETHGPTITVTCQAAGMTSEDVESMVTYPIEVNLLSLPGVEKVCSTSRLGGATIWVKYKRGTDHYQARQSVAKRLERADMHLPEGAEVILARPSAREILLIALHAEKLPAADIESKELAQRMRDLAEFSLRPKLMAVSGVSDVKVIGGLRKRYEFVVSQTHLAKFDITLLELARSIEKANTAVAGDDVAEREVLIRSAGQLRDMEDIANVVIRARDGHPVRVKDVAEVNVAWTKGADHEEEAKAKRRHPSTFTDVILGVQLAPTADARSTGEKVDAMLKPIQERLPAGVKVTRNVCRPFHALVERMTRSLGRELPPSLQLQPRSTKRLGDHLVSEKSDRTVVKLIGPDLDVVHSKAKEAVARLRDVTGVTDLQAGHQSDNRRLECEIARQEVARYGVPLSDVLKTMRLATGERVVSRVREKSRGYDIVIKTGSKTPAPMLVERFRVRNKTGELIPLAQLARISLKAETPVIYSEDLQPAVFISYRVKGRTKSDVQRDIQKALVPLNQSLSRLGGGYRIEFSE